MIERMRGCVARYEQDGTFRCERCGLAWDHDDNDPPACLTKSQIIGREALDNLHRIVDNIGEDEKLPWYLQEQAK